MTITEVIEQQTWLGRQPVADLLMERGITVREAALLLGVDRGRLASVVVGAVPPTARQANGLADLLGAPLIDLFTEKALRKAVEREKARRRAR